MKTPHLIILVVVVILAIIGYVVLTPQPTNTTVEESPTTTQGKLDINAVCDGALAYMTFPDGASADVFLSDCKEGKHPEVIEKYKADMNLGDGAQI